MRNPASFCNVVGLRPSPGLIPVWPNKIYWFPLNVNGFMARTITDLSIALNNLQNSNKNGPIVNDSKKLDFNLLKKIRINIKWVYLIWKNLCQSIMKFLKTSTL